MAREGHTKPPLLGSPAHWGLPTLPPLHSSRAHSPPGMAGAAQEPGGERGSPRGQFPLPGQARSHWAFLEMAAGLLPGEGVCSAGGGAVPYQSWSRTSPWQMWRERELQTVEG